MIETQWSLEWNGITFKVWDGERPDKSTILVEVQKLKKMIRANPDWPNLPTEIQFYKTETNTKIMSNFKVVV